MIASLPMYEHMGNRQDHDALWQKIRDHLRANGIAAPETLTRSGDPWSDWRRGDLLMSQTCGLPFRAELHKRLSLVAAPALRVPDTGFPPLPDADPARPTGLPAGRYYSVIVVRKDDPRQGFAAFDGARLAYNEPLSQSGWGLLAVHAAARAVGFRSGLRTGSHRASARAVVTGEADIAAVDVATWFGLRRVEQWTSDLRLMDRTPLSPALPYVTAFPDLVQPVFDALKAALAYDLAGKSGPPRLQDRLGFAPEGVVPARLDDYLAIALPPPPPPGA